MSEELIMSIIAALGGGGAATVLTSMLNRRKTNADAAKIITDATKEILGEYRTRNDELEEEIRTIRRTYRIEIDTLRKVLDETREELRVTQEAYKREQSLQDALIENTKIRVMKLELINRINIRQMRSMGLDPLVKMDQIDIVTVDQLRDIIARP